MCRHRKSVECHIRLLNWTASHLQDECCCGSCCCSCDDKARRRAPPHAAMSYISAHISSTLIICYRLFTCTETGKWTAAQLVAMSFIGQTHAERRTDKSICYHADCSDCQHDVMSAMHATDIDNGLMNTASQCYVWLANRHCGLQILSTSAADG